VAISQTPINGTSLTRIGAPRVKTLRLFLFGVWLEEDFYCQLGDAGISRLSGSERAKGIAADFVEGADLVGAIHCSSAGAFGCKVRVVKDVEVLRTKLNSPAFGDQDILRELHVPVDGMWQTENVFSDIAKRPEYSGIVDAAYFRRLKSSQIEPAHAIDRRTARGRAIRTYPRDKRPAIIADARAGKFGALQNSDGTAAGSRDDSAYLIVSQKVVEPGTAVAERGGLPDVGTSEHMGVIETRRPIVKIVAVWIVQWKSGIPGIKTGDAFAKRKVV